MGMIEGLSFLFFSVIYLVTLGLVLVIPIVKKRPFNFYPLWTTLIVIVAIFISFNQDKFESPTTLYAKTPHRGGASTLTLREDGTFKIKAQELEWACYYKGNYKIQTDTLTLSRQDIQAVTDSLFSDKYLIDKNKLTLFPLDNFPQDTTRWLTITDDKE